MARPCLNDGRRNLIADKLIHLRQEHGFSQRELAHRLQLIGMDMDKNVITRIETNKRYVTDIELRALASVFRISYSELLDPPETAALPDKPAHEEE